MYFISISHGCILNKILKHVKHKFIFFTSLSRKMFCKSQSSKFFMVDNGFRCVRLCVRWSVHPCIRTYDANEVF